MITLTITFLSGCAQAILESTMGPREEILFLAQEMTKVPDNGDERVLKMKEALKKSLQNLSQNDGQERDQEEGAWDERY